MEKSKSGIIIIMAAVISMLLIGASGMDPKKMNQENYDKQYEYGSNEYYKDLLKNRIEVDTLFEGNFRVHYINGGKEVIKEYLSYPRLDTTEIDGKVVIDSVMTYYELSLSPTRHSILIQEYVYPKEIYNKIEEYLTDKNINHELIELKYSGVTGCSFSLKLKRIYYSNSRNDDTINFRLDIFNFKKGELKNSTEFLSAKEGRGRRIILISDSLIGISGINMSIVDKVKMINLKGDEVASFYANSMIGDKNIMSFADTVYLADNVCDPDSFMLGLEVSKLIIFKITNSTIIEKLCIEEVPKGTIVKVLNSRGIPLVAILIRNAENDYHFVEYYNGQGDFIKYFKIPILNFELKNIVFLDNYILIRNLKTNKYTILFPEKSYMKENQLLLNNNVINSQTKVIDYLNYYGVDNIFFQKKNEITNYFNLSEERLNYELIGE